MYLDVLTKLVFIAMFIPSVVFHEVAHGYVANLLGDPTAKRAGRLTLNPLKHIDLIGTIVMPAVLALTTGWIFGYAKPVPINPAYFKNYRVGMLLTGLCGPATNLVFAVVSGAAVWLLGGMPANLASGLVGEPISVLHGIVALLWFFYYVNLILLFINLIPIPPLDGSRIWPMLLNDNGMRIYAQFEQYSLWVVLGLFLLGPIVLGIDPIGAYFSYTVYPLRDLLIIG